MLECFLSEKQGFGVLISKRLFPINKKEFFENQCNRNVYCRVKKSAKNPRDAAI
jgi:hypothetical protein